MVLLAFSIVIALQAVGVVLVSAMLITPAAAAYLLTDRLHRMLWLASLFGMLSGAIGAFLSFLGNNLPTGPFMVLAGKLRLRLRLLLWTAPWHRAALAAAALADAAHRAGEYPQIALPDFGRSAVHRMKASRWRSSASSAAKRSRMCASRSMR
jgi:hypothetical protein